MAPRSITGRAATSDAGTPHRRHVRTYSKTNGSEYDAEYRFDGFGRCQRAICWLMHCSVEADPSVDLGIWPPVTPPSGPIEIRAVTEPARSRLSILPRS